MGTLIYIWDAPGAELATWPTAIFAVQYKMLYNVHASRISPRGPCVASSYTAIQRYTLYSYTSTSLYTIQAIQHPSACAFASRTPGHAPTFSRVSHIDRYALVAWEAGPSVVRLCGSACLALASIAIASIAPEQSLPSMVIK